MLHTMLLPHSSQKPGEQGTKSGGSREFAPYLTRLANSIGVNGFFFEVHENPEEALSDGPNMIFLKDFKKILENINF